MTQNVNTYGGIGSRTNLFADELFLAHATPMQVLERYATTKRLPKNKTLTIAFRRSIPFDVSDVPIQEGVTPTPEGIQVEDVQVTIRQYGNWFQVSDVVADALEDDIIAETTTVLAEQAAQQRELINFGVFRAGTNVFYSSTTATPTLRTQVNAPMNIAIVRKVQQFLDNQYAKYVTKMLKPSADYGTAPVAEGYVGITHTDLRGDLYDMPGFVRAENYASGSPEPNEIGKADGVRFVVSAFLKPLLGAGSATLNGMRSVGAAAVDVYTTLVVAKDAWGVVPLAGTERPIIKSQMPGVVSATDPLGQRGFVSYKMWHAALILNQNWTVRAETGSTA